MPGMRYMPVASTTVAPAGIARSRPTALMRPPSTTTTPRSIGGAVIGRTVAPRITSGAGVCAVPAAVRTMTAAATAIGPRPCRWTVQVHLVCWNSIVGGSAEMCCETISHLPSMRFST